MAPFEALRLEDAVPTTLRLYGEPEQYNLVELQRRDQREGVVRWSINLRGYCLNQRTQDWEWEPQPSSREDEFLRDCRFESAEAAFAAWRAARAHGLVIA
jgi:hypothetical protein